MLKSVKEQLRAVPGRGLGYGALRYLTPADRVHPAGRPGAGPAPQVSFNYLGRTGAGGTTGPLGRVAKRSIMTPASTSWVMARLAV